MCVCLVTQSCPTLCNPMDCSSPGFSVHRIFQVRILEWVTISSSRGSSWPRDQTHVFCVSFIGRRVLYHYVVNIHSYVGVAKSWTWLSWATSVSLGVALSTSYTLVYLLLLTLLWASLVAQMVKNPPALWDTWLWSLGWEDPLQEGMATHSSILAWRVPVDRGAWQATVHGVTKSWTHLSD